MTTSLQEQLLKAGLTDPKAVKNADKEKRKQAKVARKSKNPIVDEVKLAAQQAAAEKAAKDKVLNAQQQEAAQRKAINAQIKQLVETHRESRRGGEIDFHFTDGSKVKKLLVTGPQHKRLAAGLLMIVKQGDQYELIPGPIADKIAQRDPDRIINCRDSNEPALTAEEQDWYKDFEIPDDLMW